MNHHILRKLILCLALAALTAISVVPFASAAGSFKAVVDEETLEVYAVESPHDLLGTLSKGDMVNVEAVKGKAALINANGRQGICAVSSLKKVEAESADSGANATDVVTTRTTRIYSKASTSSRYVTVKAGTKLKLLAVNGSCAMVSRNGRVGYTLADHLGNPGSTVKPTAEYTGTNEQIIVRFLMNELGYNRAAACGVAANIKYESGFEPTLGGDHGTSYGIVQWHASRKNNLFSWCSANGYDPSSLKGQLYFLKYELTTSYPMVHKYLLAVSDDASGAYDAGYYFCYHFEAPSGKGSKSVTRGKYARDTLFARYA